MHYYCLNSSSYKSCVEQGFDDCRLNSKLEAYSIADSKEYMAISFKDPKAAPNIANHSDHKWMFPVC